MAKKKGNKQMKLFMEEISSNIRFFPLTADFESWWGRKVDKGTGFKRTAHLVIGRHAENILKDLKFDVEIEGDLWVRSYSSWGLPLKYDREVTITGKKKVGNKTFEVKLHLKAPSWSHFYYEREFYINGKKVERDKFFEELIKEDPDTKEFLLENIKRKMKEKVFDL